MTLLLLLKLNYEHNHIYTTIPNLELLMCNMTKPIACLLNT
ncbi:013R [Invertebrate iridescent virus Kaz2018]|nr:013R [Invertebrate iridescent virus Kaz2018]